MIISFIVNSSNCTIMNKLIPAAFIFLLVTNLGLAQNYTNDGRYFYSYGAKKN